MAVILVVGFLSELNNQRDIYNNINFGRLLFKGPQQTKTYMHIIFIYRHVYIMMIQFTQYRNVYARSVFFHCIALFAAAALLVVVY